MEPETKLPPVWLPGAFCAALCAIVMTADIGMQFAGAGDSSGVWKPAFFCFLPMVFWFVGVQEHASRRRIAALEARLRELEGRVAGGDGQ